ncbi:MAG: hypothetical protein H7Z75_03375 [Ferruginibacter sp.]|nr:hypothetical protein [Cytophagales bacterium]
MRGFLACCLLFTFSLANAHVGSPGVVYQGVAGPYRILVNVQPPDVIPGTAQLSVFVEGAGVRRVTVQPIHWVAGDEGAPSPDEIQAVAGQPGHYQGLVWLMWRGSSSVRIAVEGAAGRGTASIPVLAAVTAQREMPAQLGWILAGLGALLLALMVTTVGASVSDGTLKPGEALTPALRRKRLVAMGVTTLLCGLILYGGSAWWNGWADDYRRFMYRPITATARVDAPDAQRVLTLRMDTASVGDQRLSYLVADHGKLMHLFLVRQGTLDVFAHLHPVRKDTVTFQVALPNVPAGRYLVYADVVFRNGFPVTITDTVDISVPNVSVALASFNPAGLRRDTEDTYVVTNPLASGQPLLADSNAVLCGSPGIRTRLSDGSLITWEQSPGGALQAGKVYPLTFRVQTAAGQPAALEPYLGMMGHAAVLRDDGRVFIHLHPVGTYSMAQQQFMESRIAAEGAAPAAPDTQVFRDSVDQVLSRLAAMNETDRNALLMPAMNHAPASADPLHAGHEASTVAFPYAFPEPGDYRIWVQIKREGKILTGAFDAKVR